MKISKLKYLPALILIILTAYVNLTANQIKFEQISTRDGLSNGNINWIAQDHEGYLWISTIDGLNKYDGYSFTNYRFDPNDPYSIPANYNHRVIVDSTDNIWLVLSNGGITRFDKKTGRFYWYELGNPKSGNNPSNVSTSFSDSEGNFWLGSFREGLFKIELSGNSEPGKENIINYFHEEGNDNTISGNRIFSIIEDNGKNIWICTNGGLSKIPLNSGASAIKNYKLSEGKNNFIQSIWDGKDKIYISSFGKGLVEFSTVTGAFKRYVHSSDDSGSISNDSVFHISPESKDNFRWVFTLNGVNRFNAKTSKFKNYSPDKDDSKSIIEGTFIFFERDKNGISWFGTPHGISRYNAATDNFTNYYFRNGNEKFYERYGVKSIHMDNSGIFWLGTAGGGIVKFNIMHNNFDEMAVKSLFDNNSESPIDFPSVLSFMRDRDGILWIGTGGEGLLKYNPNTKEKTRFTASPKGNWIKSNWISSILEDNDRQVWIGTFGKGVFIYNKERGDFEAFPLDSKKSLGINDIKNDDEGNIYIATGDGLVVYNPETKKRTVYRPNTDDPNSIGSGNIWTIYITRDNEIWIGTAIEGKNGGLSRFNKQQGTFINYVRDPNDTNSINNQTVNCIYEDKKGLLWVGTYSGGLNVFNRDENRFSHYTTRDGLPSNTINGILEDDEGNLWVSTNKGISKFNPGNKSFMNYDNDDGISGVEYNRDAYLKINAGNGKQMFLFGSKSGMDSFYPSEIITDMFIPPIVITSFKVLDESRNPPSNTGTPDTIDLNYDENFFSFEFASLDFDNPNKNIYSYKLEGFDKEWITSNTRRYAGYTNIEPGEYKFTVRGTNSDGVWNEAGTSVIINISPPFWKTWWFYTIVIVTVISLTLFLLNLRIKRKVRYLLEIEKAKAGERELVREEASRDYHDELGHKLTRISLYSRRMLRRSNGNGSDAIEKDLKSIIETSNSLQSGAKDLIWALNPEEDTMYDVCVRLKDFGNELFEGTDINFTSDDVPESFRGIKLNMTKKRHIIYIFREGMTNVLKHSQCSTVILNFKTITGKITITLQDNGIGFNPNNGQKGYGIKNIINRSKHIDSDVQISSEEKTGTVLQLDIKIS